MSPVWGVAILVLSVWFLLAVLSSAIALRKNRSVTKWYLLTLLFGIVHFSSSSSCHPSVRFASCLSNAYELRSDPVVNRDSLPITCRLTFCTTVSCVAA